MRRLLIIMCCWMATSAVAQDPHFSQYYAAPMYLNPAFSGTTLEHRFVLNHRIQWPSMPRAFSTFSFSYDYNNPALKSGFGLLIVADQAGVTELKSTTAGFIYSYKFRIMDKWVFSPGLYFGYGNRSLNYNRVIFGDQLSFDNQGNAPSIDPVSQSLDDKGYLDIGTGFIFYNRSFWSGMSVYHLNEPNRSLLGDFSKVPMKWSFHGGFRLKMSSNPLKGAKSSTISPSFVYKRQGPFDQLDAGFNYLYEPITFGIWYRGIPIKQNVDDNISQDALVVILGMKLEKFEFSYSYDFTVSRLGPPSGGSHEVALIFQMESPVSHKVRRKEKFIPCPSFIRQ